MRIPNTQLGLMLTFTAAVSCSSKGGGGGGNDIAKAEAFADAACRCWDLVNLGDVYFQDQDSCLRQAGAFALGFPFYETECTITGIRRIPELRDELSCHLDAMQAAIPCFEAIDTCDYANDPAWNDCFLMAAAWETCGILPIEDVYSQLYPACVDY